MSLAETPTGPCWRCRSREGAAQKLTAKRSRGLIFVVDVDAKAQRILSTTAASASVTQSLDCPGSPAFGGPRGIYVRVGPLVPVAAP